MNCGIYKIENKINNKIYIGQSKNIKSRIYNHKKRLALGNHYNSHLQESYNKYGLKCFNFETIEYCNENLLNEREIFWIKKLNTFNNGYNLTEGGSYRNYACADYHFENIKTKEIAKGKNISDFCLKHNLPLRLVSHFSAMALGVSKRNTCLGWRNAGTSHQVNRMKPFKLKHIITGEIYEGSNISDFCRTHKLNRPNVIAMMKGRQKTAYGWINLK